MNMAEYKINIELKRKLNKLELIELLSKIQMQLPVGAKLLWDDDKLKLL